MAVYFEQWKKKNLEKKEMLFADKEAVSVQRLYASMWLTGYLYSAVVNLVMVRVMANLYSATSIKGL